VHVAPASAAGPGANKYSAGAWPQPLRETNLATAPLAHSGANFGSAAKVPGGTGNPACGAIACNYAPPQRGTPLCISPVAVREYERRSLKFIAALDLDRSWLLGKHAAERVYPHQPQATQ
jgi:hypothetical protein